MAGASGGFSKGFSKGGKGFSKKYQVITGAGAPKPYWVNGVEMVPVQVNR